MAASITSTFAAIRTTVLRHHSRLSSNMAPPPNLATLPPEIFEFIAERAEPHDLVALRLVCRSVNDKVLRTYTRVHFPEQEVRLGSEQSLRNRLAVAGHAVFGPILRTLIIHPHEHDTTVRKESLHVMRDTQLDLHLLTTLLCKLRRLGTTTRVKVFCGCILETKRAKGLKLATPTHDMTPLMTVIEALALSSLKPDILEIESLEADISWSIPMHTVVKQDQIQLFQEAIQSSESLSLDLWLKNGDEALGTKFLQAVAASSCLKRLVLVIRDDAAEHLEMEEVDMDTIGKVVLGCDFPGLEELVLSDGSIFLSDTVSFIRRHRSLKKFGLEGILVDGLGFDEALDIDKESVEEVLRRCTGIDARCDLDTEFYREDE